YPVELMTTSDYTCSDTMKDTVTIYPFVKANFAIDYSNNCSPLNVSFTNTSKGGEEFNWRFGDGDTYYTFVPEALEHIYQNNSDNDTTFFIDLTAVNNYGCADSVSRSVFLFPRVVAAFDFTTPNQGCNPLTINFANNSTGRNLDYMWDFGDMTYSTSQNPPPRNYKNSTEKDTTYYVNLTVMNLAGCDSSVTRTVQIFSKVTADFAIERVDSCSPFKIKVDNYSSGGISEFTWKYTDDDSITLFNFSDPNIPLYRNTSGLPVKYPMVLRTRNIHGCSALKADTITVFPEIYASFDPGVLEGCQPLSVPLVNQTNITNGTTFFWNFGDGRFSNLTSPPPHVYNNNSVNSTNHNILLEATSQYGCFDDTSIQIEVYPYIYAKFNLDRPEACSDELFTIDRNSSAGAINHYFWDYQGDGFNDEDKSTAEFNYSYPNTGNTNLNRTIKLTVTNAQGCDTSWRESIMIHSQVIAAFDYDNQEVCFPSPIRFTNNSEPSVPLTFYWEFGDGSTSADIDPIHPYKNFSRTSNRLFNVKLTATSEYGCDSSITGQLTIHPKPLADFSFVNAVGCPPFEVQFTGNSIGTSLDYAWDFDNGETSDIQNPFQVFNNTQTDIVQQDIMLVVTTDFSCSDTVVKPLQVYPGVTADFDASEWDGCSPLQINLNGTAINEDEYYWYIDGKVISNYEDPTYRFVNESSSDRTFNVEFRAVSSNGCSSDTIKQITIYPKPLAEFLPSPQAQDFNTETDITQVTFNNQTNNQSIWNYSWDFGDGSYSDERQASFVKNYNIWGEVNNENRIPVILTAVNASHPQCADTIMHHVIIIPPLPKIEIGPDISGCMPLTVDFGSTSKYADENSFQWDFGYENQSSDEKNPDPVTYDTAGMYIVRVSVTGAGGTSWDYKTIQVYPSPIVNFNFDPKFAWLNSQTEPGTPIKFFNNTYNAVAFEWNFDDGTSSNERQPQHEYHEAGTYYITLRAENEYGCWDTLTGALPAIIEGHGLLRFPNAISIIPDSPADEYYEQGNDANRRVFRPLNQGIEKYKLEIYNRWGELIFESQDVNKGWNGFIKGEPVKQDVYVWRVTATFTNGQPYVDAGDVTVLVQRP
ncbi:MAG TPA: PKD domain-containing protein, partial [Bacteroidales bacterium]|nr:PKD domain-containing protein [Bacteroidales bacterium]